MSRICLTIATFDGRGSYIKQGIGGVAHRIKIKRSKQVDSLHMERMETEMARDVDRISDLPDHLLHRILVKLPLATAAKTSLLSHRWRRVWTCTPALSFSGQPSARMFDAVDAALASYTAPCLNRLAIILDQNQPAVPAARANAWLRFASQRLAGELLLSLSLPHTLRKMSNADHELDLPACEMVTTMTIFLTKAPAKPQMLRFCRGPLLRLPVAGTFVALRVLEIHYATLVCEDLGRVVSEQSPCLLQLELRNVYGIHDLNIRSSSLERIVLCHLGDIVNRLDIATPRLFYLELKDCSISSISIAAPVLSELIWDCTYEDHYASSTHITVADCHLGRLEKRCFPFWPNAGLFQQFDTVNELCLYVSNSLPDMDCYNVFIRETNKLPRAKILQVQGLLADNHGIAAMLHLLRKCDGLRLQKLKITMLSTISGDNHICTSTLWPKESWRMNDIALDSLQEIEINYFNVDEHFFAFLELLFIGCKISPKRLVIYPSRSEHLSWWIREKIERLAYPNTYVKFL